MKTFLSIPHNKVSRQVKLITFILRLFSKRKTRVALFSEALAEAASEMSEEMGYQVKEQDKTT